MINQVTAAIIRAARLLERWTAIQQQTLNESANKAERLTVKHVTS